MAKFQSKYYIYFSLSLIFFCFVFLLIPFEYALNFANDDSFFYLKIAKNLSEGAGFTFDGLSKTSGFHPLYLFILYIIYSFSGLFGTAGPETLYRITCIFHVFIIHIITFAGYKIFRKQRNGATKFTIFVLLSALFVFIRDFGIESHLSCLLILLILGNNLKAEVKKSAWINPLLLSLLFLSRTDYLWSLIPFLILYNLISGKAGTKKAVIIREFTAVSISAVIYYGFNLLLAGNAVSISAAVINSFPVSVLLKNLNELTSNPGFIFNQTSRLLLFIAAASFTAVKFRKHKDYVSGFFLFAASGLFLNLLVHLLFNRHNIREWYLTLPLFTAVFPLCFTYEVKKRYLNTAVIIISFVVFAFTLYSSRLNALKWESSYEYAKKIEDCTGIKDFIYQYDFSGAVSFFSNRNIVNGDGLVNDYEYLSYIKSNKIPDYIVSKKVRYVSTILKDSIRFDNSGNFIFQNEPFLNSLNIKHEGIILISEFHFKSAARNEKGFFVLLRTNGI